MRKHSEVVVIVSSKVDKLMQENKNQNVDMVLAMNYSRIFISFGVTSNFRTAVISIALFLLLMEIIYEMNGSKCTYQND